jgi:glycosyltransferase involved in cell wall biosynthesis
MKVLWISSFPSTLCENRVEAHLSHFFTHPVPWITSHLSPPANVELHIACLYPGGKDYLDFIENGASWHLIPVPPTGRASTFFLSDHKYYEPLFLKIKPDVVHAWGTEDSNAIVAEKLMPSRTLIGIQGLVHDYLFVSGVNGFFRMLVCSLTEIATLSKARQIVAESIFSIKSAAKFARKAEFHVVDHPVRIEIHEADWNLPRLDQILFVGNLSTRKGIKEALIAFSQAAPANWRFRIAGSGEKSYVEKMKNLAVNLGVADRVSFLGSLSSSQLIEEMQSSSIFLLPTKSDTGPTALKEAICMGLWPVCFDNSGPSEYINNFKWGSLAKNLNQQDLYHKLKTAIMERPWENFEGDTHPAILARSFFSTQTAWNKLIPIYESIVGNNPR